MQPSPYVKIHELDPSLQPHAPTQLMLLLLALLAKVHQQADTKHTDTEQTPYNVLRLHDTGMRLPVVRRSQ